MRTKRTRNQSAKLVIHYRPSHVGPTGHMLERNANEIGAIVSRMRIHQNSLDRLNHLRVELGAAEQRLRNNLPGVSTQKPLTNWILKVETRIPLDERQSDVVGVILDTNGNYWKWNCGWYLVDKTGKPTKVRPTKPAWWWTTMRLEIQKNPEGVNEAYLDKLDELFHTDELDKHRASSKQRPDSRQRPMGHLEFRSRVVILHKTREKQIKFGKDRPGMQWRRIMDSPLYDHPIYGAVKLKATDGVKAVVECEYGGETETVIFANLTERKAPLARLFPSAKEAKARGQTPEALQKKAADLFARYVNMSQPADDEG
jgi:hypothetical protein